MPVDAAIVQQAAFFLASILVSGGAVYGGIRRDLKSQRRKLRKVDRVAKRAHRRIDGMAGEAGRRKGDK